ncbi:hypothetical protein GFS24_09690 [Chitinophaga sp. SYP-B3965]|uniref:hypothetical protein n=1 Tax=Chitinophaga sp. SYP-B3965 TaxID=2663120 RepID=UPI001299FA90|nr:hypothetical protein [Chitinophaga sp. SYP-B3965]MRG45388.1 hypothetical protein [Chitinophaga sp. SYP-B3965]
MKTRRDISQEIENTLSSIDGVQRAEPGDFFFTRLQARMQRSGAADAWERFIAIVTRPSIAIAGVLLILAVNGIMFIQLKPSTERTEQAMLQQDLEDEYQLGITTTFYDFDKPE